MKGRHKEQYIDDILSKIVFKRNGEFAYPEFRLTIKELHLTEKRWDSEEEIERSIRKLNAENIDLSYKNLNREYETVNTENWFEFLISTDYPIESSFVLRGIDITVVVEDLEEKLNVLDGVKGENKLIPIEMKSLVSGVHKLLSFKINSKYYSDAVRHFESVHALLKGILEYSYAQNHFLWKNYSHERNDSSFFYPRFILVIANGFIEVLKPSKYTSSTSKPIDQTGCKLRFGKILDSFNRTDVDMQMYKFLSDVFRLYGLGKDSKTGREAYLLFWNVLEKLLYPFESTGNTNEILKRAKVFQFFGFMQMEHIFKQLAIIRNDLVHRGVDYVEELYISYLNTLLHNIIEFLFDNLTIINSKERLETFLQFSSIPYSNMVENMDMIKGIMKQKV
ncbi:MAG: hypothetical protein H6550_06170 [Chitinophagales bacterium]|nr:hypothetical protein [Chitinophagales bacterium]